MQLLKKRPAAVARLRGKGEYSGIFGIVRFYQLPGGILVEADVTGLPNNSSGFYGFHIHEGADCGGTDFSAAGGHLGSANSLHPRHAGDLPPLLGRNGRAYLAVVTDRFALSDIYGRPVVIHAEPDDFRSQPAGNAGEKIACGTVTRMTRQEM